MGLIAKQENTQVTKSHVSCKTRKLQMTRYGSHVKASKLQVTSYGSHAKASKRPVTKYGSHAKPSKLPVTNYGSHAKPSKLQVTSYGCYVNYEMWLLACHLTLIVIHATSHSWIGWAYVSSVKLFIPAGVLWSWMRSPPPPRAYRKKIKTLLCTYVLKKSNSVGRIYRKYIRPKSRTRGSRQRPWRPGSVCQANKGGAVFG
jgi:hypothetical protein